MLGWGEFNFHQRARHTAGMSEARMLTRSKNALEALATLDDIIYEGIQERVFPGAVVGCGQPNVDGCLKYFAKG